MSYVKIKATMSSSLSGSVGVDAALTTAQKKNFGAMNKIAQKFQGTGWSKDFRDKFCASWAELAIGTIGNQIRTQNFEVGVKGLSDVTVRMKTSAHLSLDILHATPEMGLANSLFYRRLDTGSYAIEYHGSASTPFGGNPISLSVLASMMEEGTSRIPARPYFAPGLEKATREIVELVGEKVFKSLMGAEATVS